MIRNQPIALQQDGYTVLVAADGGEALELSTHDPSICCVYMQARSMDRQFQWPASIRATKHIPSPLKGDTGLLRIITSSSEANGTTRKCRASFLMCVFFEVHFMYLIKISNRQPGHSPGMLRYLQLHRVQSMGVNRAQSDLNFRPRTADLIAMVNSEGFPRGRSRHHDVPIFKVYKVLSRLSLDLQFRPARCGLMGQQNQVANPDLLSGKTRSSTNAEAAKREMVLGENATLHSGVEAIPSVKS